MVAEQTRRAMVLARGLGTRMQEQVEGLRLDERSDRLAGQGIKGLIPVGRPFLDHTLQALLDAGLDDFCLIVAPGASAIRTYYEAVAERLSSVGIHFAEQAEPRGTADAVAAGSRWAGDAPFMIFNSDNFYKPANVSALAGAPPPATLAYERGALIAGSNISAERVGRFAVLDIDQAGYIRRIVEKPDDPESFARNGRLFISMNCFLLTEDIFRACEAIGPHPVRGEYELPTAVQYTIDRMGLTYRAVTVADGVLDLTSRADIEPVRAMLADHEISFPAPAGGEGA